MNGFEIIIKLAESPNGLFYIRRGNLSFDIEKVGKAQFKLPIWSRPISGVLQNTGEEGYLLYHSGSSIEIYERVEEAAITGEPKGYMLCADCGEALYPTESGKTLRKPCTGKCYEL